MYEATIRRQVTSHFCQKTKKLEVHQCSAMFRFVNSWSILGLLLCMEVVYANNDSGCSDALGLESKKVTDKQISVSSKRSKYFGAIYSRLNGDRAWCPSIDNVHQWLQIDFNETKTITAVKTQGAEDDEKLRVEGFALLYSYEGTKWYNYTISGKTHIFAGQDSGDGKKVLIPYPITARFIRINPHKWPARSGGFCLRLEFYGCTPKEDCFSPVGMEDGRIKDFQISASSVYDNTHYSYRGRLNNKTYKGKQFGAWCAAVENQNQYLQIDLLRKRNISAVATQGYDLQMFVKKYRLNYSTDGVTWMSCRNKDGEIEFNGNRDNNTIEKHVLNPKVEAKYIRFNPTKWNEIGYICMRVEVYECLPVKGSIPNVFQKLPRLSDVDERGSINLTCVMEAQAGIIISWYKRRQLIQQTNTERIEATELRTNRMQSTLSLLNVTMDDNGIKFECRGNFPDVHAFYASTSTVLRVGADQPPLSADSKTSTTLVLYVPYRKSNVTDKYKFQYRQKNNTDKWKEIDFAPSQEKLYTIKDLEPWRFYEVKVTPIHKNGVKGPGRTSVTEVFRTAEGVPSAPRMLKVVKVNEYNATISWQPPKEGEIRGIIKHYLIKYDSVDKTGIIYTSLLVDAQRGTVYTMISLLPNTRYMFQIACVTGGGEGPFSDVHHFTTAEENSGSTTIMPPLEEVNLETLNQINITERNAIAVAANVKNLTSEIKKLKAKDVALTADILEKIVETKNKNPEIGNEILKTISQVSEVEPDILEDSDEQNNTRTRLVKVLENFLENGGNVTEDSPNIIVRVDSISKDHVTGVTKTFGKNASIEIPGEALVKNKNKTMYFVYYKNGKLFHTKRLIKEICLESGFTENIYETVTPVISGSIAGRTVENLSNRVILKFSVPNPKAFKESSSCVFWDFSGAGGAGDWSKKGCKRERVYNNTIECSCDHMTNFAALLDVYAETSKACGAHAEALIVISYCGCVLSICGLLLTIFTYLFFKRLRKELAAKILIQLCIALLCVLIVFIVGIERSRVGPIGCYIVAVMLHYFVLAAFMWMLIEAHFMYLAFVKVWSHHGDHELLKCSFIAWGLPAIIVGITMAVNLDNYGGTHYCRIERIAFFAAYFAPILCIVFVNLVVFGIILYKLNNRPDSSLGQDRNATAQRMKQAVGIMILVGITWAFGALAISKARLVFHYLFAIFNSIQGFSIFVFYCLSQKNVRESWKALLTCQLNELHKEKSYYTNTYDRRRCSTASTTHNNTLSLARKKTSTSSANMAYPSHSMDTLTRDFTSYNCSSSSLPKTSSNNKPNNLNNFVSKNCNVKEDSPDVWKRMSNVDGETNRSLVHIPITISNSNETVCSEDSYHVYDLVENCNVGSVDSVDSAHCSLSQGSGQAGFYSFVNSSDSLNSLCNGSLRPEMISRSAPSTPAQMKRPQASPLSRKKQNTMPASMAKPNMDEMKKKHSSDQLSVPGDFGKLIVNPSRGSVRGVMRVVETSVGTYDENSPDSVTPQEVRLTQDFKDEQRDVFDPEQCITSPAYFADSTRSSRGSKGMDSSTDDTPLGDIYL